MSCARSCSAMRRCSPDAGRSGGGSHAGPAGCRARRQRLRQVHPAETACPGYMRPTGGVSCWTAPTWRRSTRVTCVQHRLPQPDVRLFAGSLRDNLNLNQLERDDERLMGSAGICRPRCPCVQPPQDWTWRSAMEATACRSVSASRSAGRDCGCRTPLSCCWMNHRGAGSDAGAHLGEPPGKLAGRTHRGDRHPPIRSCR